MKAVIVGCGRVGSFLAAAFDEVGHEVIILDTQTAAFDRLPPTFKGSAVRGDGTDEDVLLRAGAMDADLFLALTEGDNRNIMAGQLSVEALGARQAIAKVNDPVRADAYAALGVATLCRTNLMAEAVFAFLGMPSRGLRGIQAPTGSHPGGEHHGNSEQEAGADSPEQAGPPAVGGWAAPGAAAPDARADREG
jgi:trk system potassium uptake protein TrkA